MAFCTTRETFESLFKPLMLKMMCLVCLHISTVLTYSFNLIFRTLNVVILRHLSTRSYRRLGQFYRFKCPTRNERGTVMRQRITYKQHVLRANILIIRYLFST